MKLVQLLYQWLSLLAVAALQQINGLRGNCVDLAMKFIEGGIANQMPIAQYAAAIKPASHWGLVGKQNGCWDGLGTLQVFGQGGHGRG